MLNLQWGMFGTEIESEFEVRPQFDGVPRIGFYSNGGFVDLRDLANGDAKPTNGSMNNIVFPKLIQLVYETYRNDEDFRVETVATGNTFSELPSYPYFSKKIHRRRIMVSWTITIFFAAVLISFTFLPTFYNRQISRFFQNYPWGTSVPGILTGALIFAGENTWMMVYPILAKWENHRTNQSYIDSLIIKRFSFEFVVSTFCIDFVDTLSNKT